MCGGAKRPVALACVAAGLLFAPWLAAAQPVGKAYRIGILANSPKSYKVVNELLSQFRAGLRSLGDVPGRNVRLLYRYPSAMKGRDKELPRLAKQLVVLHPDVIFTFGWPATGAAHKATSTIPIVVGVGVDPIVKDFTHPSGNVTGLSSMSDDLVGKQLQVFREAIPTLKKVALLWNPQSPDHRHEVETAKRAVRVLGMTLVPVAVSKPAGFGPAFETMAQDDVGGVIVLRGGLFVNSRPELSNLATAHGLPSMFGHPVEAEAGGMMAYGTNLHALFKRAAVYVDKILKGAHPSQLPVERPTTFELVVNLKTAKALGVAIPRAILLQADKVIE